MGRRDAVWIVAIRLGGRKKEAFSFPAKLFLQRLRPRKKQYIQEYQNAPYEIQIDWGGVGEWNRDYSRALAVLTYERESVPWKAREKLNGLGEVLESLPSKGRPLLDEDAKFLIENWGVFRIAEAVKLPMVGTD